jgi:hypothetical protein
MMAVVHFARCPILEKEALLNIVGIPKGLSGAAVINPSTSPSCSEHFYLFAACPQEQVLDLPNPLESMVTNDRHTD